MLIIKILLKVMKKQQFKFLGIYLYSLFYLPIF